MTTSEDNTAEKATRVEKTMLSIMDAPRALANALVPGVDLGLSRGEGALSLAFAHLAQSAIEDVYADCGDSDARVLASNVGQRIAWNVDEVLFSGPEPTEYHAGFDAGRASRDSEVAVLRERVAELEAVVQGVSDLADAAEHGALRWTDPLPVPEWVPRVRAVLKSPSEVLAAVRREAAAEAVERFASDMHEWYPEDVFPKPTPENYHDLNVALARANLTLDRFSADLMRRGANLARERAAEIRAGGNR